MNKFDRIGDWRKFSKRVEEYIVSGPQGKYGSKMQFNDLCHYTGLRIMAWNIFKYALRLWNCCGKANDFEKTAHYSQMAWTLKERQGRKAPFFKKDVEGDYVVMDETDKNRVTKTKGVISQVSSNIPEGSKPYQNRIEELNKIASLIDRATESIDRTTKRTTGAEPEEFKEYSIRAKEYLIKAKDRITKTIKLF